MPIASWPPRPVAINGWRWQMRFWKILAIDELGRQVDGLHRYYLQLTTQPSE